MVSTSQRRIDLDEIRVLCVDDDPGLAELTVTFLERHNSRITGTPVVSAEDATYELATDDYDCIVSDYDMPGLNGVEFLETVRADDPDIPFIMYTGRGSEEIASEAISAGVTDYMRKESGTDQYAVLAKRICTTVERIVARRTIEAERKCSQTILDASPSPILVGTTDGLQYANSAAVEAFGAESPEGLIDTPIADLLDENELEQFETNFELVLRGEVQISHSRRTYRTFSGDPLHVELTARKIAWDDEPNVVVILTDVTALVEQQQTLEATQQQLQGVLDAVEANIWMRDSEGRYLLVNDQYKEVFDLDKEDVVGVPMGAVLPDDLAEQFREYDQRARASKQTIEVEQTLSTRLGDRPHLARITPLYDDDGTVFATCGVATDISRQKEREAELEVQTRRLEEFASVVSHDLRNPLNTVEGYVELVRENPDEKYFEMIEMNLDRANRIIDDVLWLARENRTIGETEVVELREVVEASWNTVATQFSNATLNCAEDIGMINADRDRLQQLLENLFRNAVEHGGPEVTVVVERTATGFSVEDNGTGIPDEERDRVFETGVSLNPDGSGLGLGIIERITEAHGWSVELTEGSLGGARFEFTLPTTD